MSCTRTRWLLCLFSLLARLALAGELPFTEMRAALLAPEKTLEEVRQQPDLLQAASADAYANLGYSSQALWLQIRLPETGLAPHWLQLHYPILDEVDFWVFDTQGRLLKHTQSGDRRALKRREIRNRYPLLIIDETVVDAREIYVRVQTQGSLQVPLRWLTPVQFWQQQIHENILIFGYCGVLLALSAFNLFLYFSLRDRSYLFYVIYVVGTGAVVMTLNGVTYEWLWPDWPRWANYCLPLLQSVAYGAFCFFTLRFVALSRYFPRIAQLLRYSAMLAALWALTVFHSYRTAAVGLSMTASLVGLALMPLSAWIWWRHDEPRAKYYLIAWAPFVLALFVLSINFFGIAPLPFLPMALVLIASAAEMILLSLALAARVRLLQAENEHMHRSQQSELATQVALRTRELTRANHELAQANKDMEFFAYAMAHDLKAPLRAIIGFGEHLQESAGDRLNDDQRSLLQRMRSGALQLKERIEAIVALARLSAAYMQHSALDLADFAREVLGELRAADPDRQADISLHSPLPVFGDATLLRTVVQNLLENAWKYSAKKSVAQISMGSLEKDGETIYYVRDNGAGFDMSKADILFRPFQRLHTAAEFPGSGIGLANVAKIIQRHKGRIWAESGVDQGTTILFTLPRE